MLDNTSWDELREQIKIQLDKAIVVLEELEDRASNKMHDRILYTHHSLVSLYNKVGGIEFEEIVK